MRFLPRSALPRFVVPVLMALPGTPLVAERPSLTPVEIDPAAGFVEGVRQIAYWPAVSETDHRAGDPTGFEVHLVPRDDRDRTLVYPAGTWFKPPEGTYLYWLEGKNLMSPFLGVVRFEVSSSPSSGVPAVGPVVAAGKIKLSAGIAVSPSTSMHLLHLESHLAENGRASTQMTRQAAAPDALRGVAMPAGKVVAALWDNSAEKYTAVEVVRVPNANTVEASPQPPAPEKGAVYLELEPPRGSRWQEEGLGVLLKSADGSLLAADEIAQTLFRTFAVWLSVPVGESELILRSREMKTQAEDFRVRLEPGTVFHEKVPLVVTPDYKGGH